MVPRLRGDDVWILGGVYPVLDTGRVWRTNWIYKQTLFIRQNLFLHSQMRLKKMPLKLEYVLYPNEDYQPHTKKWQEHAQHSEGLCWKREAESIAFFLKSSTGHFRGACLIWISNHRWYFWSWHPNTTPTICHSEEQSDEESRSCLALFWDSSLPSVAQNDTKDDLPE